MQKSGVGELSSVQRPASVHGASTPDGTSLAASVGVIDGTCDRDRESSRQAILSHITPNTQPCRLQEHGLDANCWQRVGG